MMEYNEWIIESISGKWNMEWNIEWGIVMKHFDS